MKIIIVANNIEQFLQFVKVHFPALPHSAYSSTFLRVLGPEDMGRVMGLTINSPIIFAGGDLSLFSRLVNGPLQCVPLVILERDTV
jgi:hypothetical protein